MWAWLIKYILKNKKVKDKLKKKGKSKTSDFISSLIKEFLAVVGLWGILIGGILLLCAVLFFAVVISYSNYGASEEPVENETVADGECECGCVWVENVNGTPTVNIQTVTTSSGEAKLLGKAEISNYTFEDNDNGENYGHTAASCWHDTDYCVEGISAAVGAEVSSIASRRKPASALGYSGEDTLVLEDVWREKINSEYGGNWSGKPYFWVYVEGLGVRLIHDRCGVGHRLDIYTGPNDPDKATTEALNNKHVNVYYIGEAEYGDREPPAFNESTISVPSYGATTGSLTNTSSAEVPVPTTENHKALLNHLLPAAVVGSQYYNIHIRMTLGLAPCEGGWNAVKNGSSNEYHVFSVQGNGPMTGKTSNNGRWSAHEDYNDAVLHFLTNFKKTNHSNTEFTELAGEGYAATLNAYSSGPEEQIRRLSLSGYNNYKENGANTIELYKQSAEAYANRIINITKDFPQINDIDIAMKYMEQNGLMDEYQAALDMKDRYEALYNAGYANATPNSGGASYGSGSAGGTTGSTQPTNGHWVCACPRPCDKCSCHDNETENGQGTNADVPNGQFPPSVAGQASGLWGTTEQLQQYINSLDASNQPKDCSNLTKLKANLNSLMPLIGSAPAVPYTYNPDKFIGADGYGFINYNQSATTSFGVESFRRLPYNDGSTATFGSSGCGIYSMAMVLSTLEKKWVNPAEVAIAMQTYGVRNGGNHYTTKMGGNGAAYGPMINSMFKELGYTTYYNDSKVDISKLDDCLSKNGCAIIVVNGESGLTRNGHYIVIREKAAGGYLVGNSMLRNNTVYTQDKILGSGFKNTFLLVYPKANTINKIQMNNAVSGSAWDQLGGGISGGGTFNNIPAGGSSSTGSSSTGSSVRDIIVNTALDQQGVKYLWGGETPSGFDCSGLMVYSYKAAGINLPRKSSAQYKSATKITEAELKPGDLIFGGTSTSNITHVMMYIGNNQFIHSPQKGKTVCIRNMNQYNKKVGYGRYVND